MNRLYQLFQLFGTSRRANVAVTFSLLLVPLLGMSGAVVNYSQAVTARAKVMSAADQALMAGLKAIQTAIQTPGNSQSTAAIIASGQAYALQVFNSQATTGLSGVAVSAPAISYTRSGQTITGSLSFTGTQQTSLLNLVGLQTMPVSGNNSATLTLPSYIDFYLMTDVSGSMGLPSTDSEQSRLAAINPDKRSVYPNGCTFACHFSDASGFTLSRNGGDPSNPQVTSCPTAGTPHCIQLRTDAVGMAITQLLQTAQTSAKVTNQFRIGLYPFIAYLYAYYPLTTNLSAPASDSSSIAYAASVISNLLDTGKNANLGSGGTHFENAFPRLNSLIASVGDGSSPSNTLPFVFLVTDGSQDYQQQFFGNWSGSNSATTLDPSYCTTLKSRGITIGVLYIPYQPIQNPTDYANSEDFYANANIPYIAPALQTCASAGYFYTANTPADITTMMGQMFAQAVQQARLSQ